MHLLFLDFDGVLHSTDAAVIPEFQFRHLGVLSGLLGPYPEVRIAISSNWASSHDLESLKDRLGELGHRVVGATSDEDPRLSRFRQCEAMAGRLNASSWVMIDDQVQIVFGDEAAKPQMMRRVIFCDSTMGLTTPGVQEKLLTWLRDLSR
ncbi:MAG: hypothetical protein LC114_14640 [Bryobacterales bacterium]|jgi:hypothetical protein|nr:hypothetical protein [Bryobacterales bacterium]